MTTKPEALAIRNERDNDVREALRTLRYGGCYDIANRIAKPWCRLPYHGRVNYSAIVASLKRIGARRDHHASYYSLPLSEGASK